MPNNILDFERPIVELENKIEELKKFSLEKNLDLSTEIETLEQRALQLKREIFGNLTPWQKVQIARHPDRPNTLDYIRMIFQDFVELHGDRRFGDDRAIRGGIARLNGRPVTVLGHCKGKGTKENILHNFGMPHPEGNRKALRLMEQAEKFNRPIIAFIDTPGAYCGIGAEERGQGEAIANNLKTMINLKVPIAVVVIGEGGSGGALAIAIGDYLAMLEHSVFSIISPEGFASILWKDASRAQEAASVMKLTSADLKELGIIDEIIPEPLGGAHRAPEVTAQAIKEALIAFLEQVEGMPREELLARRFDRYRSIGRIV